MFNETIIAELGSVHDGSFGNAMKLVEVAAACGADIAKFQTHIAEAETLANAPMPPYFKGEPRIDYFRRTAFSESQWRMLANHARDLGIGFMSSPFSLEAVNLLEDVGVDCYKIASGEVTNIPLLKHIAKTRKPVLMSSGMSNWAELDRAMAALDGAAEVVVMQCTSAYPCPPDQIGLNVIGEMQRRYRVPVGFSDHTTGAAAAVAAAALGAVTIEKHLTFSRLMYGSDAANAMEPDAFKSFAAGLREVWQALANPVDKGDVSRFGEMKLIFEKSIVTARAIGAGTRISEIDLAYKKPGDGIPAERYLDIVGKTVRRELPANHKLTTEDFE